MDTQIRTADDALNTLYPAIRGFLEQDPVTYTVDAETVHGYRSPDCPALWIRDHSDMMRRFGYLDEDGKPV